MKVLPNGNRQLKMPSVLFRQAVKELMILGTISFVLFILKDQNVYDQSDDTFTNTFDVSPDDCLHHV